MPLAAVDDGEIGQAARLQRQIADLLRQARATVQGRFCLGEIAVPQEVETIPELVLGARLRAGGWREGSQRRADVGKRSVRRCVTAAPAGLAAQVAEKRGPLERRPAALDQPAARAAMRAAMSSGRFHQ